MDLQWCKTQQIVCCKVTYYPAKGVYWVDIIGNLDVQLSNASIEKQNIFYFVRLNQTSEPWNIYLSWMNSFLALNEKPERQWRNADTFLPRTWLGSIPAIIPRNIFSI